MQNNRMNSEDLKKAIAEDIETLKTLELDIIPAKTYYHANGRLFLHVFLKLYGTLIAAIILPYLYHWRQVSEMPINEMFEGLFSLFGLALGLCTIAFLFIYSSLNHYVLVNYQLRRKLKTGEVLVDKIRLAGNIAFGIFATIMLVPAIFLEAGMALFVAMGAFFVSAILTNIIIEMEVNRIGLSAIFILVNSYFDKDKTKPAAEYIKKR